jgi:hypothetical protein
LDTVEALNMALLSKKGLYLIGVALGALYGLVARLVFSFQIDAFQNHPFEIMSVAFIFGVPVALGFITVLYAMPEEEATFGMCIVMPWLSGIIYLFSALALAWEGIICIIIWLPLVMILSSVGGVIAWVVIWLTKSKRDRNRCLVIVTLLPFAAAPIEQLHTAASEVRTVNTQIKIHARVQTVWDQIKTVPMIRENEQSFSFSHMAGFPRPLEAKLVGAGVGAVRYATFEHGVLFLETITEWDDLHRLSFSIHADTEHIPPHTFDEHVTIGGKYFDVLRGTYWIEPVGNGDIILHLSSDQRLSTRFNFYTHLWTGYLMADLQDYILKIIKKRCEQP